MPIELSHEQFMIADRLSSHAHDVCALIGMKCSKCQPKHFYLTVHRYYGRVPHMVVEMERCIDWCLKSNKQMFTAQRFGNWCANKVKWAKEDQLKEQEKEKLKAGNVYQRADYKRRFN